MELNLQSNNISFLSSSAKLKSDTIYDVIIVGAGPAGYTAALYCLRKGILTGIIAKELGGKVTSTTMIENYTGIHSISGNDFAENIKKQIMHFPVNIESSATVSNIEEGALKTIHLSDGRTIQTKTVIIATGTYNKRLGIAGENEFLGKGVSYCSICDALFYKNKNTVIVGGGNSAVDAAIDLSRIANQVTLVHYKNKLKADQVIVDKMLASPNVNVLYDHRVTEIKGNHKVGQVVITDLKTNAEHELKTDGVFIEIGLKANSDFLSGLVEMNNNGEIIVDAYCKTSKQGIFAAGDITNVPFKQIVIAAGEGAKAALSACEYLSKLNN